MPIVNIKTTGITGIPIVVSFSDVRVRRVHTWGQDTTNLRDKLITAIVRHNRAAVSHLLSVPASAAPRFVRHSLLRVPTKTTKLNNDYMPNTSGGTALLSSNTGEELEGLQPPRLQDSNEVVRGSNKTQMRKENQPCKQELKEGRTNYSIGQPTQEKLPQH